MRKLLFAALLSVLAGPAFADGKPPAIAAIKPPAIAGAIKAEQPYGTGKYRILLFTIYDIALWTDATAWSMQTPFALVLTYHLSFSSSSIVDRSLEEMKHDNPALSVAALAAYRAQMAGLFPDGKSGDTLTGLYAPDGTAKFFHNGEPTGEVHDPAFAQAFFGIWLSPQTSDPGLRAQLLHLRP